MKLCDRVVRLFKGVFTPRPKEHIVDWAKREIALSPDESPDSPGGYDPDLNPLPTIIWDIYESGEYDECIVKKSTQSGITLAVLIFICWWVVHVCRNFLYAIDAQDEVKKISELRLQPLLRSCGAARRIKPEADAFTNVLLKFRGLVGYLIGARSTGKMANKSVGLAAFDEVDAVQKSGGDISAIHQIRDRMKKQMGSFFIVFSKAEQWEWVTNQEYLSGSRHKCFVPCPHCTFLNSDIPAGFQTFEWEQVKFAQCKDLLGRYDKTRVLAETFYECIHCKEPIRDTDKPWMLKHRRWEATNKGEDPEHLPEPRKASVEITDLYSTFPKLTFGHLALKFVNALGNQEALDAFFSGHLARPKRAQARVTEETSIYKMTANYYRGQAPVLPRKIVIGSDKQKDVYKWVKAGFTWEGDCYVIDWGQTLNGSALTTEADVPVKITTWPEHYTEPEKIDPVTFKGFVDERYRQKDVRDFVVSTITGYLPNGMPDYRFYSCYGLAQHTARNLRDIVSPAANAPPNAFHNGRPMWAYAISVNNFNDEIHNKRFGQWSEIEAAMRRGQAAPPHVRRIFFPLDIQSGERGDEARFVHEITREQFFFNDKKQRWEWKDVTENDWGDALRMCFALWYLLAPLEQAPLPLSAALPSSGDSPRGESSESPDDLRSTRVERSGRDYVLQR